MYDKTLKAFKAEMASFDDQHYFNMPYENLPQSNIRPHYRKLRQRQQALLTAADDLTPILVKDGLTEEERLIKEDLDSVSTQITAVKFTYGDNVSKISEHSRRNSDTGSNVSPQITNHQTSPGIWTLSSPQNNTTPITTSLNAHCNTQYTPTVSVITGGITSTIPPPPSAKPHLHTVVCTSETCTTEGIIHSQNYMPYINAPTNNTPTSLPSEVVNPQLPQHTSRETSPSTFNTNANNSPREPDILAALQHATREEMSSQVATIIQSVKDMFISLQRENARLQADIVQISHRMDQVQSNAHRTTTTT